MGWGNYKDNSMETVSIKIDDVTYYNADYAVPVIPPQSSIVKLYEFGEDKEDVITAYAIIEDDKLVHCCIDGTWYKFLAEGIAEVD